MGDIEILYYMIIMHPLKYHDYCKYHNIYLLGYNSAVNPKSQAYRIKLCHMSRNVDVFQTVCYVICMILAIIIMVAISVSKLSFISVVMVLNIMASK